MPRRIDLDVNFVVPPTYCANLELKFSYKVVRVTRNLDGQVIRVTQSYTIPLPPTVHPIERYMLTNASTCHGLLHELLYSLSIDDESRVYLAPRLATYLMDLARKLPFLGFHVVADAMIVFEEVFVDSHVAMSRMMDGVMMMDGEDTVVAGPSRSTRGVSRSILEKLKQQRLFVAPGDDCAICLEEFGDEKVKKLIKMPCAHVFHENCIFRWLKDQNSCPMCRREVDI